MSVDSTDTDVETGVDVQTEVDAESEADGDTRADADTDHLSDVPDGCGCAEVWEHTSDLRED